MKASKKSRPSSITTLTTHHEQIYVNTKEKQQCGYCGLSSGHRYDGGCKIMSATGSLLKKEEIDNFRIKLTHRDNNIQLQSFTIPENSLKLIQTPPKTKFLYVHGFGRIEQDKMLSQLLENNSNFLCLSFVFENSVIREDYSKCFVCALAVSDIGCQGRKNRKK